MEGQASVSMGGSAVGTQIMEHNCLILHTLPIGVSISIVLGAIVGVRSSTDAVDAANCETGDAWYDLSLEAESSFLGGDLEGEGDTPVNGVCLGEEGSCCGEWRAGAVGAGSDTLQLSVACCAVET